MFLFLCDHVILGSATQVPTCFLCQLRATELIKAYRKDQSKVVSSGLCRPCLKIKYVIYEPSGLLPLNSVLMAISCLDVTYFEFRVLSGEKR
jgi:hypothetical protein